MNVFLAAIPFAVIIAGPPAIPQNSPNADAPVIGTWEGESKCTVPDSPCHDEHVVYEIAHDKDTGTLKIDAYKIVNSEKQFMGTLQCKYNSEKSNLSCAGGNPQRKADWQFTVMKDTMQGSLFLGDEKTLYRKISLKRKPQ